MKKQITTWYVGSKKPHVNRYIATVAWPDATHEKNVSIKGFKEPMDVLEVTHQTLLIIERSICDASLNFETFVQTGTGPIRKSPFHKGRLIRSWTRSA